jgi:hypothetical protein
MDNTKPDLTENLREQAGVYTLPHVRAPPLFHSFPRLLSILRHLYPSRCRGSVLVSFVRTSGSVLAL